MYFIYLFLAVLALCCCMQAFLSCSKWGLLFVVVHGLLTAVSLGVFLPLHFFGIVTEGKVLTLLYIFGRIHLWSHLVLDFCLLEIFKSQFQVQYLWLDCSYFLFLPGSVFGDCTSLRICPILLGCPFYWQIVAYSSLLRAFVFLWCCL